MDEDAINEAAVADAVLRNARREGTSESEVDAVNVLLLLLWVEYATTLTL